MKEEHFETAPHHDGDGIDVPGRPAARGRRPNERSSEDMMKRTASAMWNGDLKTGKGTISTDSGVLSNTQYSFEHPVRERRRARIPRS